MLRHLSGGRSRRNLDVRGRARTWDGNDNIVTASRNGRSFGGAGENRGSTGAENFGGGVGVNARWRGLRGHGAAQLSDLTLLHLDAKWVAN
jgi:hypothetical protein